MENNVIEQVFGKDVFNDEVMQAKLPKDVYKSWKKTLESGADLDIEIANVVAHAMKEWALEHGATHYTHWFQPMTGVTAEKHSSVLHQRANLFLNFREKSLLKGSRMHLHSHQVVFVQHLKPEDIQLGIVHHLHSFRRMQQV